MPRDNPEEMDNYEDVESEETMDKEPQFTEEKTEEELQPPSESSNVEGKFKLSLQNIEKRFVDLELVISEIREKVNSLKADEPYKKDVEGLRQRMGDIEDLIMVEQAGILELKKVMEVVDEKFDTSGLENKINEIESLTKDAIENLKASGGVPEDLLKRIDELERRLAEVQNRPGATGEIRKRIEFLQNEVKNLKESPSLEEITHLEIGELKKNFKVVIAKIEELSISLEKLERDVYERLESAAKGPSVDVADLDVIKSSLGSLKANFDILNEKRAEDDMKLAELEGRVDVLKKFVESSEYGTGLEKGGQDIEEFKKRLNSLEMNINQIKSEMGNVEKTIGEFKVSDGIKDLRKEIDEKMENFKSLQGRIESLSQQVGSIKSTGVEESSLKGIESRLEDKFNERLNNIGKGVDNMTETFEEITNAYKDIENIKRDIKMLNGEMKAVRNVVANVAKISKTKEVPKELPASIKELKMKISDIESSLVDTNLKIEKVEKAGKKVAPIEDTYIKEMIDKLVFLESRLAAIESMFESPRPIILE